MSATGAEPDSLRQIVHSLPRPDDFVVAPDVDPGAIRMTFEGAEKMPDPQTMALLFTADRQDHNARMDEWFKTHDVIVTDRYSLSTALYQGYAMAGEGFRYDDMQHWISRLTSMCREPGLTVILDVPPHVAQERMSQRELPLDQFERKEQQQAALAEMYLAAPGVLSRGGLGMAIPVGKEIVHVNADQPKEMTEAAVWQAVSAYMDRRRHKL